MSLSEHVSNTDYHNSLKKEMSAKKTKNGISDMQEASCEGAATFYGAGGRVLLKKMAVYFDCYGAGRHSGDITAAGFVHRLLDGELDIVRVSDGKGFWHEEGYNARPEEN